MPLSSRLDARLGARLEGVWNGMEGSARKRVRRSVEASRQTILEAAERALIAEGPHGVKVQTIARELGLTDAAIHYHFGNREGLLEALLRFSGRRFVDDLTAAMEAMDPDAFDPATAARMLSDLYDRRGTAKLVMWLSLSGWSPSGAGMLEPLAHGVHEWRSAQARQRDLPAPDMDDSRRLIALLSALTFTQALTGKALLSSVGLTGPSSDDLLSWAASRLA